MCDYDDGEKWVYYYDALCQKETEKALLVEHTDFDDDDLLWIPRSVVADDSEVQETDDEGVLQVARWWALEKGLL